jgi:hypothetical protein
MESHVDWKQQFLNRAFTLIQDPRVAKVVQDPRVMSGLMSALKLRSELQRNLENGVQRLAKSLDLASEAEVRELRRAVSRLERELERARNRREPPEDRPSS